MNYYFHIVVMIIIYSLVVLGLQLIVGYVKIWFLGAPVVIGISAYSSVLVLRVLGLPILTGSLIAILIGVIIGYIFSLIALRIEGDLFLIISLSACEVGMKLTNEMSELTGGAIGIMNISPISVLGIQITRPLELLPMLIILIGISFYLFENLKTGITKILFISSGEDKKLTRSLGNNPNKYIKYAFLISGAIMGLAGFIYAHYNSYLDPSIFSISESILIFSMVIIGGLKNRWGFLIGATIFYSFPLFLQNIGLPDSIAFKVRPILFGLIIILYMFFLYKWKPRIHWKILS